MPTAAENHTTHCQKSSESDFEAFRLLNRPNYQPSFSIPFQHPVPWHIEENRDTALHSVVLVNRSLREIATP